MKLIFWLFVFAVVGPQAVCQTPDLSEKSLEELMNITVTTASKHEQLATQAPASVTVITHEEIDKYGYRTLADALRSVRGFYVTYDRNYSYVGVRGFGPPGDYNMRVLLLVDGHRMNDNIFDEAMIGTEFPVDMDLVERIEVIRGPASSLYGSNALFGVINVITRRGRDINGLETSFDAASFGSFGGRVTYGSALKGIELVVSGTKYDSRGQNLFFPEFNLPETSRGLATRADDDQFGDWLAAASWRGLRLQGLYSSREKGIPTASYGSVFNDRGTRSFDGRRFLDLRYERTFSGKWEFSGRVFYDQYRYDGHYIYSANHWGDPGRVLNIDIDRGDWWGSELKVSREVMGKHRLSGGAEYRNSLRQWQGNFDVLPFYSYLNSYRSSRDGGLYLQDEYSIHSNLILNAGVRFDRYGGFEGAVNPRLGLMYQPSSRTNLKVLYGTAFRVPNAFELYCYAPAFGKTSFHLSPEQIRSTELVLERQLAQRFTLSFSGYYNWMRNLIAQDTDLETGNVLYRNVGKVAGHGMEVQLSGNLHGGWEGRASYAVQDTHLEWNQNVLANSPRHLGKINVIVPLAKNKLSAGLEGQYTSRRKTVYGTAVGGFPVFNLTLFSTKLLKPFEVSGSLYNVFDKRYGDPVRNALVENAIQQDGRNFRLKLTWRWGSPR